MSGDMLLVYLNLLSSDRLYGYCDSGIGDVSELMGWDEEIKRNRIEYWLKRLGVENER